MPQSATPRVRAASFGSGASSIRCEWTAASCPDLTGTQQPPPCDSASMAEILWLATSRRVVYTSIARRHFAPTAIRKVWSS